MVHKTNGKTSTSPSFGESLFSFKQLERPDTLVGTVTFILFLMNAHFLIWNRLSKDYEDHVLYNTSSSFNSTYGMLNQTQILRRISYVCGPTKHDQPIYYKFTIEYMVSVILSI